MADEPPHCYRPIRRVRVEAFWMCAAHAQWYACCPLANAACPMPRREEPFEQQERLPPKNNRDGQRNQQDGADY